MKMSEKDCFKIDTRGICLLCYTPSSSDLHNVTPQFNSSNILKQFLRYIKVMPGELFGNSPGTSRSVEARNHEVNVQVSMCSSCSSIINEFGRLYASFVLIMVEMDACVLSVVQSIKSGNKSPVKSQQFLEQMNPIGFADMINFTVASNLRNVALERCVKKLQLYNLESQEQTSYQKVQNFQDGLENTPEKKFDPTSQQHIMLLSQASGVSDTELEGESINNGNNGDKSPLTLRKRSAKTVAMIKVLESNDQSFKSFKPNCHKRVPNNSKDNFKCKTCSTVLSSNFSLRRHMKLMHSENLPSKNGNNQVKCKVCFKEFPLMVHLKRHMKKSHPDHKPSRQQRQDPEHPNGSLHYTNSHVETLKDVDVASTNKEHDVPTPESLNEQTNDLENGQSSSSEFSNSDSVDAKEITKPAKNKAALSSKCKSNAKYKNKGTTHRVLKSKVAKAKYRCGKANVGQGASKTMIFNCITCKKKVRTILGLKLHMRKMHNQSYNGGQSPKKSSQFSSAGSPSKLEKAESKPTNDHVCTTCGKGFERKNDLTKHMRSHIGDESLYLCLHCPLTFSGLKQLRKHDQNVHSEPQTDNETTVTTPMPDNETRNFEDYIKSDTGEKSYPCLFCPDKFAEWEQLKNHEKTVHSDPKEDDVIINSYPMSGTVLDLD